MTISSLRSAHVSNHRNCETMFSFNAINTALKNSILLVARFRDLPQSQLSEKNDLRLRFVFARWLKK